MNLEQLKIEHPDLVQAIVDEAQSGMAEAIDAAVITGAEGERARIADVRSQSIPGHEALIEQLAFDGKSTGADAALAIVGAEKALRSSALEQLDGEAPTVVPSSDGSDSVSTMKRKDFDALDQASRRAYLAGGGKVIA